MQNLRRNNLGGAELFQDMLQFVWYFNLPRDTSHSMSKRNRLLVLEMREGNDDLNSNLQHDRRSTIHEDKPGVGKEKYFGTAFNAVNAVESVRLEYCAEKAST